MSKRKLIDAHIHPFISTENSIAPYGSPQTLDEFMEELKRCGFSRVCGSVLIRRKTDFAGVQQANRIALEIRDRYPDFYEPGIHVHGDDPEGSCRELEYMRKEQDVRWIGELVHYAMGTGLYNTSGMFQIYDTASTLEMPVNIHCSDLDVIEDVLKNFPKLKLIVAHPEDIGTAKNRFELIRKYENAYLDISGTGLFRWNMLRYAIDRCGKEKLLFGSDFPVCSAAMNLGGVLGEHLSEDELDHVLGLNFLNLTGRC